MFNRYLVFVLTLALTVMSTICNAGNGYGTLYKLTIKGEIANRKITGSVKLICYERYLRGIKSADISSYISRISNGRFRFVVNTKDTLTYYQLFYPEQLQKQFCWRLNDKIYLIRSSCDVGVLISSGTVKFVGRCQEMLNCQYRYQDALYPDTVPRHGSVDTDFLFHGFSQVDATERLQLEVLDKYKGKIAKRYIELFETDIKSRNDLEKCSPYIDFRGMALDGLRKDDSLAYYSLNEYYKKCIYQIKTDTSYPSLKVLSFYFTPFVLLKTRCDYLYQSRNEAQTADPFLKSRYLSIKQNFVGIIRDKLVTALFLKYNDFQDSNLYILDALSIVGNGKYGKILNDINKSLNEGAKAYNFSLIDTEGCTVTLKDFGNKLMIMDFWFTGCENCRSLRKAMSPVYDLFRSDTNVIFISICIDKKKDDWKNSVQSGMYTDMGETNLYTGGLGQEDSLIKYYAIKGYPTLLIIKSGKVISGNPPRPQLYNFEPQLKGTTIDLINLIKSHSK